MTRQSWYKHTPWIRLAITAFAVLVVAFCVGLIVYGSTSTSNDIALGILAGITALLALGQWFFPFSPKQSEAPQMPLACELVRGSFRMGDEAAANFPYITASIQTVYTLAKQALLDSSTGASYKRGILIVGEVNAGKTRLAVEALIQTLPGWPVLRWWPDSTIDKVSIREKRLIIFIDDLQEYVSMRRKEGGGSAYTIDPRAATLRTLLERLRQEIPRVVLVATCRLEDKERVQAELGQLFNELQVLQLPTFNVDVSDPETTTIITDFQAHGSTHIQDWDGTLGSLVLGLSTKNSQYLAHAEFGSSSAAVLRAMKLLTRAQIFRHSERLLKAVCADVFGVKVLLTDEKTWREAVNQLVQEQFVTEELDEEGHEVALMIRKDIYFDQVITDYLTQNRPHQLLRDFIRLQNVLMSLRDAKALVNLGIAFDELERPEEALASFEQAIRFDPNSAAAYFHKGLVLFLLERYEEALTASEQAIRFDPNFALTYIHKGLVLFFGFERHEEALAAFEQAIHLDPSEAAAYYNKGDVLAKLKRYEEALAAFEQAIHLDPYLFPAHYNYKKGIVLAKLKRYEEALAAFEQAIRLDLNNADAYYNKGLALIDLERYEEALAAFEQAIRFDPNSAAAYIHKGTALACLERYEEALADFEYVIRLDPTLAGAYNIKGLALTNLERYEKALAAFEQAIRLDPTLTGIYYRKGVALGNLKRHEEALAAFEQAIRLDPTDARAYCDKGVALDNLKRNEEALAAFEQAIRLDPTYARAFAYKGDVLNELGREKEAQQDYGKARQLGFPI